MATNDIYVLLFILLQSASILMDNVIEAGKKVVVCEILISQREHLGVEVTKPLYQFAKFPRIFGMIIPHAANYTYDRVCLDFNV